MARWESDARGRLEQAAMQLYAERGFDATTTAEVAARAGLTERTFFRHFADKREVLFSGAAALQALMEGAVVDAPAGSAPLDAVAAALHAAAGVLQDRRDGARHRQAVVAASAELRERELVKLATLAGGLAQALRGRGVPEPAASLTAETGVAVFKVAVERWADDDDAPDLSAVVDEALGALRTVAADPGAAAPGAPPGRGG